MSSAIGLSECADWFESSCIYLNTLVADCEQTAICWFIGAFTIVIVPHKHSSFEAVKFYLNIKCRYSDSKHMYMFIVKTIQWNYSKQSCQRLAS